MSKFGKFLVLVIILLSIGSYAYACKPDSFVDITQPVNNFSTDKDTLAVTVVFGPYRCKHKHEYTKTELIVLKIDNIKVAAYDVPKKNKDGSKDFTINISSYTESSHVLRAFAYKDNKGKHEIAKSDPVTFIIKRGPTPPPVTPQSGFIHGVVYDADNNVPLTGVSITIKNIPGTVITDNQGKFSFPTPGTGDYGLTFNKLGYLLAQREINVVSTRNTIVEDVYLKPLDSAKTLITNAGGTHTSSNGKIIITIPPNALPQGTTSIMVQTTLYEDSQELPAPLPSTSFYTYCLDLEPDGTQFSQPISGKFANDLNFVPGAQIPLGLYNFQTLKWEDSGIKGVVSVDGKWVEFQMTHFSVADFNLPALLPAGCSSPVLAENNTPNNNDKDLQCAKDKKNSTVWFKNGELSMEHSLPSFKALNQDYILTLSYNSANVNPTSLISFDVNLDTTTAIVPLATSFKVNVEGIKAEAIFKPATGLVRYSYMYDCKNANGDSLATGSYPYTAEISNIYDNATYGTAAYFGDPPTGNTGIPTRQSVSLTSKITGRLMVNNLRNSPFGSGWSLIGLQRLYFDPDGALLLTEGNGSAKIFTLKEGLQPGQNLAVGSGPLSILISNGDGTFQAPATYPVGDSDSAITADFNNDDINDLVMANSIMLGNGNGTFQSPVTIQGGSGGTYGDFNHDGFADVAFANPGTKGISILLGKGNGTFQTPVSFSVGGTPSSIANGDFNTDGADDLVATNIDSDNIFILLNNGDGTFQAPIEYQIGFQSFAVKAGDLNQDDITDLIITSNAVSVLLGNGDGTFRTPINYDAGWFPAAIAIEDFNLDGLPDFAVANAMSDTVSVFMNTGNAVFQIPITIQVDATPVAIASGNFNQDNIIDLAVANNWANNVSILLGNGDGTFQDQITYPVGSMPKSMVSFNNNVSYQQGIYVCSGGDYSFITKNPDQTYTRFMKDGAKINFNQFGLHTSTVDNNSNIIDYSYTNDLLTAITLPTGAQYQLNYTNGKLAYISDPANKITSFAIDNQGDLIQITNADNTNRYFAYNTNHLMTRKTDERGNSAEYFFSKYGAITEVHSPMRNVTEIAADGTVTAFRQTEIRKYYPSNEKGLINDLPIEVGTLQNPADVVRPEDITEITIDGKGNSWIYRTNKFGGRELFSDPLGNTITYERDFNSNLKKLTSANGSTVEMRYDGKGNLISTKENFSGAQTKVTYEPKFSQPLSVTDPLGNITRIEYDSLGNPNKITDSTGTVTTMEYNARGQVTKVISAKDTTIQNETNFTYDPVTFNLKDITDPLGRQTSFTYDLAGNISTITDANNKITQFTYDPMNRVKTITDTDNKNTGYSYDNLGNLTSVTDANIHTTAFDYDEQNQLTKTTNPLGEARVYSYDINRNLSMIVTPNGAQIKLYNNPANMVEHKFLPEGVVDYTYNGEYNLTSATKTDSALNFTYDPLGRLTQIQTGGTIQPVTMVSYVYDLNNNLLNMTDPAGIVTNYTYDILNQLTDIKDQFNQVISHYDYDALSRRTSKSMLQPSIPLTTNFTYDLASQLLSITNLPTAISSGYTYDNVGNRLSLTDNNGLHSYTYDNLYRVTDSSNPAEHYSYDPVGNRNPLIQSYDSGNRLLDDGTYTYTYDTDGNMTSKVKKVGGETTTYSYNSEDQLIGVVTPTQTISYKYDALGKRIEKNISGAITRYIYDASDIIQELDGNNQVIATYTHGPGIDEPISVEKNGQKYYYIADGLGSLTALVDQNGNIAQTYRYDSFGNIINQTGSLNQPYTYTGREYDPETGLYYYRARYYAPKIGRFLQEDPIGFAGGINLYSYCINNPLSLVDPSGTDFSTGVQAHGETINPFTSGGGGIWGTAIQSGEKYDFTGEGLGVSVGTGVESVWAWGSGTWSGAFHSINLGFSWFTGSVFWTPGKGGWIGFTFGLGIGLPVTAAYTRTNYNYVPSLGQPPLRMNTKPVKKKRC